MVDTLKKIVGEDSVLSDGKEKSRFDHIWKTDIPTNAIAVVFPKETEELSSIMKACFENNQKVLVQGGLTNLVGSTKTFSTSFNKYFLYFGFANLEFHSF